MNRRDFLATTAILCVPLSEVRSGEPPELFELRVSPGLVPLFTRSFLMFEQISRLRREFQEAGLRMPLVRIRDFPDVPENEYRVLIRGTVVRGGVGGETILRDLADAVRLMSLPIEIASNDRHEVKTNGQQGIEMNGRYITTN